MTGLFRPAPGLPCLFRQPSWSIFCTIKNSNKMKTFKYLLLIAFISITAVSCTEELVRPNNEDKPIIIPPPKP
jgi:hypothetical protein